MKDTASPVHRVHVSVPNGPGYPVIIGSGALAVLPELLKAHAVAHRYAVIADARVAELHQEALFDALGMGEELACLTFPPGEDQKNRGQWGRLTDALLQMGFGRDSCVLALGGGVTGDLAGFVAATYMRGVPVVQIPTSLVAMIDSSVGGKTGVDTEHGKNLVGAFHPPALVLIDPVLASTLPREERSQGLAEAIKHGAILDRDYLEGLETRASTLLAGDEDATRWCVIGSVEHKASVVQQDEREGGLRKILNFGHTLGHALEQVSGYRIPHGTAVALGMVLEAKIGESMGLTAPGTSAALARILRAFELDRTGSLPLSPEAVLEATRTDKKARGGEVQYVLLQELGTVLRVPGWSLSVPDAVVLEVLKSLDREE